MSTKRADKNQKRQHRRKAQNQRDARRLSRLSIPTRQNPKLLAMVDDFLVNFRHTRNVRQMPDVLEAVTQLNLLKIEPHRLPVAAGIATICRMYENESKKWIKTYEATIASARWLFKAPDPDEGFVIETPMQINQILIAWLVSGDEEWIELVWEMALSEDELNSTAKQLILWYAEKHDDLKAWINDRRPAQEMDLDEEAARSKIETFSQMLLRRSDNYRIIFVDYQAQDKSIVVLTADEGSLPHLDLMWDGVPIVVRPATPSERRIHKAWRDEMEDPI